MEKKTVLIVGGYGVVGSQIAHMLHERYPQLEFLLGGRTANKEAPFISERVKCVVTDNKSTNPLEFIEEPIALVINAVNDSLDNLLRVTQEQEIPLIDITRWTERMEHSIAWLENKELRAPIIFSSGWMGGTAALLSKLFAHNLQDVTVNIHALYSLQDKAGPNSIDYMNRLTTPFHIANRKVYPLSDPRKVTFANGHTAKCYRIDTPDHLTLLRFHTITEANFRITFDHILINWGLVALVKSRVWKMLSNKARQKLLYNPGEGGPHRLLIELDGVNENGKKIGRTISVIDPLGQTHLTAVGAVVQAKYLLENDIQPRIYFSEDVGLSKSTILQIYDEYGVTIK
ncbi:saccharopine dehydrogenase [Priestia taiwanensis]|uniref:Saccharopine dehydrogenase n=1 Tax=Priestia taiwanensis TaxID=1347902 RepID=A0A917AQT4_9BACI|nr:saccharopine dehydrogenase [Priestia taiwanensis]MBM7363130.1 hypothetical protein [Priestia taiwanensis]GGE67935.1 hypothetical protein GCM10007140_17500 [Priestia taiwanensis]